MLRARNQGKGRDKLLPSHRGKETVVPNSRKFPLSSQMRGKLVWF